MSTDISPSTRSESPEEDLSSEIVRTISRSPIEHVTCRKVRGNHYRCNWWAPQDTAVYDNPLIGGLLVTTNRVCKSRFLRVTRSEKGLDITHTSRE